MKTAPENVTVPEGGQITSQSTKPIAAGSTCPSCGWRFRSRPCCGDPNHEFVTLCPKCEGVFISAVAS